jgi:hypothetical protein
MMGRERNEIYILLIVHCSIYDPMVPVTCRANNVCALVTKMTSLNQENAISLFVRKRKILYDNV